MRCVIYILLFAMLGSFCVRAGAQNDQRSGEKRQRAAYAIPRYVKIKRMNEHLRSINKNLDRALRRSGELKLQQFAGNAILNIGPPENWTKKQVKNYVLAILSFAQRQPPGPDGDPRIGAIRAVGSENVDVLINLLPSENPGIWPSYSRLRTDWCLVMAIEQLACDKNKKIIVKSLRENPKLIDVVLQKDWVQEARKPLVDEFLKSPLNVSLQWVVAVARLQDPRTYEKLRQRLVHGRNRRIVYMALKKIPDIKLEGAVSDAWEWCKREGNCFSFCLIPLSLGDARALELAMEILKSDDARKQEYSLDRFAKFLGRYTEAKGSPTDILKWYDENKERLFFDKKDRVWRVRRSNEED